MICPYCKSEIPDDVKKCAHCGEWLKGKPLDKPTEGCFLQTLNTGCQMIGCLIVLIFLAFFWGTCTHT
jgi:hypothetical protein